MSNRYIQAYLQQKTTNDSQQSLITALTQLQKRRNEWLEGSSGKYGWRGGLRGLKLFFNRETTQNNLHVIDHVLGDLSKTPAADLQKILTETLNDKKKPLSNGHTRELLQYVLADLKQAPKAAGANRILVDVSLLQKKNLATDIFNKQNISLKDDISAHANWVYQHIYSVPYVEPMDIFKKGINNNLPRADHGILHVSRAAAYVPTLLALNIQYDDQEALKLTEEDVKLIQIATLFHDSGRENDGTDFWDKDSALLLFYYLVNVLNVNIEKAKIIAEAVANKDYNTRAMFAPKHYSQLVIDNNGKVSWKPTTKAGRNIYQRLIHDADCLDIRRVISNFRQEHLDLNAQPNKNPTHLGKLIDDVESLIKVQGDDPENRNNAIKKQYDNGDCYDMVVNDIKNHTNLFSLFIKSIKSAMSMF